MHLGDIIPKQPSLSAIFAPRSVHLPLLFQYSLDKDQVRALVIDVNHRWAASNMSDTIHIIQPKTRTELLDIMQDLSSFINPRLEIIIIDDLPLYFRDYYTGKKIQTQNIRAFGACLAILQKLSKTIPIMFTTYPSAIRDNEPIYFAHTKYYTDSIFSVKLLVDSNLHIDNVGDPTFEALIIKGIHDDVKNHFY